MFKCSNCGGQLKFNEAIQLLKCEQCSSTFLPNVVKNYSSNDLSEEDENCYEGKEYKCKQCGATLLTLDDTAVTFCSYCGSQSALEDRMVKHNNPDVIIPFKITKEQAIAEYKKKVSKFFFAPKYLKDDVVIDKFRGIYMPYGVYNFGYKGKFENSGELYAYTKGNYNYYNKYKVEADGDISYKGISYDLVLKYYDNFSTAIPFDYRDAVDFNPAYIAGFYADSFDMDKEKYLSDAKNIVKNDSKEKLKKYKELRAYGCKSPTVDLYVDSVKIGMYPVYFMAARDKAEKNIHYAVINGQNGKVAADLPVDFKKYIIVSLLVSLVIFLAVSSLFTLTPTKLSLLSILFASIAFAITIMQVEAIKERRNTYLGSGTKSKKEKKKKYYFKYYFKLILAIIIPIFALYISLAYDEFYYATSIASLVLIILSFYDLVKEHNLIVSSPIPQLEKRGGK